LGKTTAALLCAKLEGYEAIEFNASDTRNKKALDVRLMFFLVRILYIFHYLFFSFSDWITNSWFGGKKNNNLIFCFKGIG